MGYVTAFGDCFACHRVFSYNPRKVPSIRHNGEKQPVCRDCMDMANAKRVANGMPAHPIMSDAYDPLPEEEL